MDGLVLGDVLIKLIGVFNRAVFHTGSTTRAFILYDIARLLNQGDLKVPCFSGYTFNLGIGVNLYVLMPADLDQLR